MNFPLEIRFKILALASQITVTDSLGLVLCYVKQKLLKLKEEVTVFSDSSQQTVLFRINADRIIDISARYRIDDASGAELGVLQRHGMRSFWRAHYELHRGGQPAFTLQEEKVWVKFVDGLIGEIPIVGMLTAFYFHPAYLLRRHGSDEVVLRLVKRPSLFEAKYQVEQLAPASDEDQRLGLLAMLMLVLLERTRG